MLSVIIPVYNRAENLKLCLAGLANQKDVPDWELIVVDDGSTDGLKEAWWDLTKDVEQIATNVRYLSGGPNKGFRGGRARNIGAFNANGDRFVFLDSDVVPNEYLLFNYDLAHEVRPNDVIVGRYFYLPKVNWQEMPKLLWTVPSYETLMQKAYEKGLDIERDPLEPITYGIDLGARPESDFTDDLNASAGKGSGLGGLSGNISYPKKLFWDLGGFDERIVGHGGEDADLGLTADEADANWFFYRPIIGYHIWHERNQKENAREVQANIRFIDAKHGVGKYRDAKKWTDSQDWADPIHYHKHLGAIIVRLPDDPTVMVCREGHYLKLNSQRWLRELGFAWKDVDTINEDFLKGMMYSGDAIWKEDAKDKPIFAGAVQVHEAQLAKDNAAKLVVDGITLGMNAYRKLRGGELWRWEGNPTVFAVSSGWKIGIADPLWITWLGFGPDDIRLAPKEQLDRLLDGGATPLYEKVYTGEVRYE